MEETVTGSHSTKNLGHKPSKASIYHDLSEKVSVESNFIPYRQEREKGSGKLISSSMGIHSPRRGQKTVY